MAIIHGYVKLPEGNHVWPLESDGENGQVIAG